ncbi:MAG TPA: L,D-transpeptidase [Candidatus Polarisedimenticolia bacterium]|nr:L,D-transpeptidase [Candidatus Polarisedimenticolia bacterium]
MINRRKRSAGGLRVWRWIAPPALVALAVLPWLLQAISGRADAPVYSRDRAERALVAAREAGASERAPRQLHDAERALDSARLEFRRQQLRFYLRRDFGEARRKFRAAEVAARKTVKVARAGLSSARDSARQSFARAECAVTRTDDLARTFSFRNGTLEAMQAARLHLAEAGLLLRYEDFDRARLLSDRAVGEARLARQRMADEVGRFIDPGNLRRWEEDRKKTIRWSAKTSKPAVIVNKDEGAVALFVDGRLKEVYDAEIGVNQLARKLRAGDQATPEGAYKVTVRKARGQSKYYKALELSYPNDEDRRRLDRLLEQRLLPPGTQPGSLIEIHGEGGKGRDWTDGCVALDNEAMDELFDRVAIGTPVTIVGGDGDGGRFSRLAKYLASSGVESECPAD